MYMYFLCTSVFEIILSYKIYKSIKMLILNICSQRKLANICVSLYKYHLYVNLYKKNVAILDYCYL